jgi:hypothetical protein
LIGDPEKVALVPRWKTKTLDGTLDQHWVEQVLVKMSTQAPAPSKPLTQADKVLRAVNDLELALDDAYLDSGGWNHTADFTMVVVAIRDVLESVGSRETWKAQTLESACMVGGVYLAWGSNEK